MSHRAVCAVFRLSARGILLAVFSSAALLLAGCDRPERIGAVGPNGEISVFTNLPAGDPAIDSLRVVYAYRASMVVPETAFYLDFTPIEKFHVHRHVKNQMYLADMSRDDRLTRTVPGYLPPEGRRRLAAREPFRMIVHDLHANGQTTVFLVGWSSADLVSLLSPAHAPQLRAELENAVIEGLLETMFLVGEDVDLGHRMALDYGWTIRVPSGFTPATDPSRLYAPAGRTNKSGAGAGAEIPGGFVKLSAESPVRLLLVHWREESVPTDPASWDPILDGILWRYNDQDFVQRDRTRADLVPFREGAAVKWDGVWQNEKYVIGGPFRAFAFTEGGRSYLIVGIVFDPGADKLPTMRQVEAMLRTFRPVR